MVSYWLVAIERRVTQGFMTLSTCGLVPPTNRGTAPLLGKCTPLADLPDISHANGTVTSLWRSFQAPLPPFIVLLTCNLRIHRGHLINGSPSAAQGYSHALSRHPINCQRQSYTVPSRSSVNWLPSSHPRFGVYMISTPYYPYPVDKSSVRRAAGQPYIYSPPEPHRSPRNAMYPHLHASASPLPTYIYSGYEQYYAKDGWVTAVPSSWPTYYPISPRSSSFPETAVNPKVTIFPSQPVLVSDVDTPSSISSHSVLTPSSPFAQHDVGQMEFEPMEFDEFDCDEDDEDDSDFADEMEGVVDESDQRPSPLYGASAPQLTKSTSALEGALGDTPSSLYGTHTGAVMPADRRLSASVPGYQSTSHRSSVPSLVGHSPAPVVTSPPPAPALEPSYPSQHTHARYASSSSLASQYDHISTSSSLAGAFAPSVPSPHASRPTARPLPILQPQPIRPIPPIPLADLTASANESSLQGSSSSSSQRLQTLSPLPLLCQPVSDAIRYQLKGPPNSDAADDDASYGEDNASEPMCRDIVTAPPKSDRFSRGLTFRPERESANGARAAHETLYPCASTIRWQ